MKMLLSSLVALLAGSALVCGSPPHGADKPASSADATATASSAPTRASLEQRLRDASRLYYDLQTNPDTKAPNHVVARAKGVMILTRTSGAVGVGGTGGSGVGLKKSADGLFSAPAFYTIGGASLGPQVGFSESKMVVFLMSDQALRALTDSQFLWSANARVALADATAGESTLNNDVDVVIYQQSHGLDLGASIAGTQIAVDEAANHAYYLRPAITPAEIFASTERPPEVSEALLMNLNQASVGWERAYAALQSWQTKSGRSEVVKVVAAPEAAAPEASPRRQTPRLNDIPDPNRAPYGPLQPPDVSPPQPQPDETQPAG